MRYCVQKVYDFGIYVESTHTDVKAALLKAESCAIEERQKKAKIYVVAFQDHTDDFSLQTVYCVAVFQVGGARLY